MRDGASSGHMKQALLLLVVAVLPLSAQTSTVKGEADTTAAAAPMLLSEQKEVLAASSGLITASVHLRPDGTARTTHRIGSFSTRVELRGLRVASIVKAPLSMTDRQQGIARRYLARLSCKAHRIWEGPIAGWSRWKQDAYGFFPSTVIVEEVGGTLVARATRISDFSPGIDSTMTAAR